METIVDKDINQLAAALADGEKLYRAFKDGIAIAQQLQKLQGTIKESSKRIEVALHEAKKAEDDTAKKIAGLDEAYNEAAKLHKQRMDTMATKHLCEKQRLDHEIQDLESEIAMTQKALADLHDKHALMMSTYNRVKAEKQVELDKIDKRLADLQTFIAQLQPQRN